MYRDNTLIPAEAVRLAELGSLVQGEKSYGDLAREIRFFVARIVGPSLDRVQLPVSRTGVPTGGGHASTTPARPTAMPLCGPPPRSWAKKKS